MIINLTQHAASIEQVASGVRDVPADMRDRLTAALTFGAAPSTRDILTRAASLAQIALEAAHALGGTCDDAMIGGAPYLMAPLERALEEVMVQALYSFSVRESVEQAQPDGSVRKIAVFRHVGWVEAAEEYEEA